MRKLIPFSLLVFLFSCKGEDKPTASAIATSVTYPYTATYSSSFEMGNAEHSKVILGLWKDFDNNTLDNSKAAFADTVSLFFANSMPFMGSRDSAMAMAKGYRAMFSKIESKVNAFVPLKSTDKNENWVCVWGVEYATMNGKIDSTFLQETWRFNKDGKVDLMYQFASKTPSGDKK
jgi:hypothetical protein